MRYRPVSFSAWAIGVRGVRHSSVEEEVFESIFSVRNWTRSALWRLLSPSCNRRTFLVGLGVQRYEVLPLFSAAHLAAQACGLLCVSMFSVWNGGSRAPRASLLGTPVPLSRAILWLLWLLQGGDQLNVNHEVVNQVDVNQPNPTQRSLFLLINQLNIIIILS